MSRDAHSSCPVPKVTEKPRGFPRRRILLTAAAAVLLVLAVIAFDSRLLVRRYTVESDRITSPVRIALVTDLHSCYYGEGQSDLLDEIDAQKPDLILLGGDIFDDVKDDENTAEFLSGIVDRGYPVYYVTGNHECWSGTRRFGEKMAILETLGIPILENEVVTLSFGAQTLCLGGVDDPHRYMVQPSENGAEAVPTDAHGNRIGEYETQLDTVNAAAEDGLFSLLLAHRPEFFDLYTEYDFDLVLCGHAHGGQWRIPFLLNGVYAPHQGIFPRYAGGRYEQNGTTMIVSRGLARETTWVPRIFNRPELVIVDLT